MPRSSAAGYFTSANYNLLKMHFATHHTMNHIRFMISPELNVVQDRAHGSAPRWNQGQSPEPNMVQGKSE